MPAHVEAARRHQVDAIGGRGQVVLALTPHTRDRRRRACLICGSRGRRRGSPEPFPSMATESASGRSAPIDPRVGFCAPERLHVAAHRLRPRPAGIWPSTSFGGVSTRSPPMRSTSVEWSGIEGPRSMTIHAPKMARTPTTKHRMTRLRKNLNRRRLAMADSLEPDYTNGWWLVVERLVVGLL